MDYNLIAKRFKELRKKKGISRETLSEQLEKMYDIKISARQIQNIENTSQVQDEFSSKKHAVFGLGTQKLYALAKYYNVSTDYILGLSDCKLVDVNAKSAHEYTKLSEKTIDQLHTDSSDTCIVAGIDYILTDINLIELLSKYFISSVYSNFECDIRYEGLPKHKKYSQTPTRFYNLLEDLAVKRNSFCNTIVTSNELKESVINELAYQDIDRIMCYNLLGSPINFDGTYAEFKKFLQDYYKCEDKLDASLPKEEKIEQAYYDELLKDIPFLDDNGTPIANNTITKSERRKIEMFLQWYDEYEKQKSGVN